MSSPVTISDVFCRVCMSRYSKAVDLYSTQLSNSLERLTGIPCAVGDGLPRSLCFLCAALLRKCVHFRDAALATDRLLRDMANDDLTQVSQESQDVYRKEMKLVHDMCTTVPAMYSYPDTSLCHSEINASDTEDGEVTNTVTDTTLVKWEVPIVCKLEVLRDSDDEGSRETQEAVTYSSPALLNMIQGMKSEARGGAASQGQRRDCDQSGQNSVEKPTTASEPSDGVFKYTCSCCDYKSNELRNYRKHQIRHTDEKCFECQHCKKGFKAKSYLRRHIQNVHDEKPFKCPKCPHKSVSAIQLKSHLKKHTLIRSDGEVKPKVRRKPLSEQGPPVQCAQCGLWLRTPLGLKRHLLIHTGEKPHQCTTCGSRFRQLTNLKIHCFRHTGEKPFKCTYCDHRTNAVSDLQIHMRKHTGEKPYKCTECNYSCTTSTNLKSHLRRHFGDKPFECSQCSKKFSTKKELNEHFFTHTGEKRYKCEECETQFARLGHYKRHLQRNARSEPFSCAQCAYSCALKCGSTRHLAEHGGN